MSRTDIIKEVFRKELSCDIENITIFYDNQKMILAEVNKELYFYNGTNAYRICSHPYEPCTYLIKNDIVCTTIHNAFNFEEILSLAKNNGVIHSITGIDYNLHMICELLLYASKYNDCDISYIENVINLNKLDSKSSDT